MNAQMSLFEESIRIECEHCGAVFILYPKTAENFKQVHGCYKNREVNEK